MLFIVLCIAATAQQQKVVVPQSYGSRPVWIAMIKDTSTNFFEAELAFKTYFEHHELPGGEHEIIGEYTKNKRRPGKRELRRMQAENQMRIEVKKYRHWRDIVLPYVQPDGHILTPAERLSIYNSQKNK